MKKLISITSMIFAIVMIWHGCTKPEETGTIYGTVTDFATGEPVKNVNVTLMLGGKTTLTGSDGTYMFQGLKAGEYSLSLSKSGYNTEENIVIYLSSGESACRDIQMKPQVAVLKITDMNGDVLEVLDFGAEESVTSKSFNIFNEGANSITCNLSYNCNWISSVSTLNGPIPSGQTVPVTVTIDRSKPNVGENNTILHITSDYGSNELKIRVVGYDKPSVSTADVSNETTTSAKCGGNVSSDGGTSVTDRGVCWSTAHAPTIESSSHKSMGSGTGTFSGVISNLSPNTTYYVCAYATNQRGTSYGPEKPFTTASGKPEVTTIPPTKSGTTVTTGGNVTNDAGYNVTARGVCYGISPNPDLSGAHTSEGSGTGSFSSTFVMNSVGIYYVRAYATNSNGTSYGDPYPIYHPYYDLPTFTFAGQTYRVAPPGPNIMGITQAINYCNNLTLYGFTDWRLPTKDELLQMYQDRNTIGGFGSSLWWSGTGTMGWYYGVNFSNGQTFWTNGDAAYVRPVRVDN